MNHHNQNKPKKKKISSPKKNKFERFFKEGLFLQSDIFDVWFLSATPSVKKNVYVMVRKKVSKKATDRNRWRRRIKEIIRKKKHNDLLLLFSIKLGQKKVSSSKELLGAWEKVFEKYKEIKKLS